MPPKYDININMMAVEYRLPAGTKKIATGSIPWLCILPVV
jgi:hypothetical protein